MKIAESKIRAVYLALGQDPARVNTWDLARCNQKLEQLLEIIDDPKQVSPTDFDDAPGALKSFNAIKAAHDDGEKITVVADEPTEATPAPAAKKVVKPKPEAEEAPAETPAEPAPAAAKKNGKAKKAAAPVAAKPTPAAKKNGKAVEKPAPAAKDTTETVSRPRGSGKQSQFGAFLNTSNGKVDAALSKKLQTIDELAEKTGVKPSTVNYRLWVLARDKKIVHVKREGYGLKK